jgi:uncharacterized RDD family membrane protein YckC
MSAHPVIRFATCLTDAMASELPKDQPEFQPVLQPYPVGPPADSTSSTHETASSDYPGTPPASGASRFASDLASPGERLTSGLIDVVVVLILGAVFTATFGSRKTSGAVMTFNDASLGQFGFLVFQAVALGYFFVTELYLGGSLGKLALGQRVLTVERTKPTPRQLAIRTAYRLVDGIPYFIPNLFGFVKLSNSDLRQRLGDRSANTVVVKSR